VSSRGVFSHFAHFCRVVCCHRLVLFERVPRRRRISLALQRRRPHGAVASPAQSGRRRCNLAVLQSVDEAHPEWWIKERADVTPREELHLLFRRAAWACHAAPHLVA